jgi:hypothetical protein
MALVLMMAGVTLLMSGFVVFVFQQNELNFRAEI